MSTNPKELQREYNRRYNERNHVKRLFHSLKHRAKKRGKVFTITYDDFRARWFPGASIDRIDNTKGYEPGNIQALPSTAANARKYWQTDYHARNKYEEIQYQKGKAKRKRLKQAPEKPTMKQEAANFFAYTND